ncbi:hypothetical protein ACIQTN_29940 [Streptomyces werraensis]|uniref:hypothetical protein n=1 Tax=Streptomyces werraensis TaxID=68284 RepID=UPI00381DED37
MQGRATIASVSGLTAGVAATVAITGQGPTSDAGGVVLMMAAWLAAMVCVTVVAMAALRKWLNAHEDRTRAAAQQVAIERTAFMEATERRGRELHEREERLNKRAEQISAYVVGIARRLDEAVTRNTHLERQLAEVTKAYEELADDHNRLVRETLQERTDRFERRLVPPTTRRTAAPCAPAAARPEESPARPYTDPHGGHHPVAPIPLRRTPSPAARLSDQPQHERPVEGVGGTA